MTTYLEERLHHVRSNEPLSKRDDSLESYLKMKKVEKSVMASLYSFSDYYRGHCLLSYYDDKGSSESQYNAWQYISLTRYVLQIGGIRKMKLDDTHIMYALVSNNKLAIHWLSQYLAFPFWMAERGANKVSCHNPRQPFYHWLQPLLAMQGDWKSLEARAQYFLNNPPKKGVLYRIDSEFYIALANGDVSAMEDLIAEMVSPKVNRIRGRDQMHGYEEGLVSVWGVTFSKLAWMHGYEVNVDSPLVPQHWLSFTPLEDYSINLECEEFNTVDFFQALPEENIQIIKNLSEWSPRPIGEPLFTYADACRLAGVEPIS